MVTLDPFVTAEGAVHLDLPVLGMARPDRFAAYDKVSGETFDWGEVNFVRLEPWRSVAHILAVRQG